MQVTGSGRIDFQPSVFQRPAMYSSILGKSALGIEASHLGFHSVLKGENIILFDNFTKTYSTKEKNSKFKHTEFFSRFPLSFYYALYILSEVGTH